VFGYPEESGASLKTTRGISLALSVGFSWWSLSPREEMLLRLRFGIGSEVEYTLGHSVSSFHCRQSDSATQTHLASCDTVRTTFCPNFDQISDPFTPPMTVCKGLGRRLAGNSEELEAEL
jgi:hypothetical protein